MAVLDETIRMILITREGVKSVLMGSDKIDIRFYGVGSETILVEITTGKSSDQRNLLLKLEDRIEIEKVDPSIMPGDDIYGLDKK